ncbi:hypothetical protein D3C78_721270 [compost metagenome]
MIGRQAQLQSAAGVPVGVIGIGGEEGIAVLAHAPPGELGVRPGHLHQTQAAVLHDQAQAVAHPRLAGSQHGIGQAQRQQLAGGLFDPAIGIGQQVVEIGAEQRLCTVVQAQADIPRIRRQLQRRTVRRDRHMLRLQRLPALGAQRQAYSQGIHRLAVLQQLGGPLAFAKFGGGQRHMVDATRELQRQALLLAGIAHQQFGGDRLLTLVEGEDAEIRLVAGTEARRPAPLQVQRLLRANELLLLSDLPRVVHRPRGDAPTGQRVGHAEAEARLALGIGDQLGLPGSGIDILPPRPLQNLHPALAAVGPPRRARAAGQRHVVADKGQAGAGANVVAPRMVEELADVRGDLRLQRVDHLVHHADRQARGRRFAGESRAQFDVDCLTRLVALLVGGDGDIHLRRGNLDPGVLEAVIAGPGIEHGEGQVRRELFLHRDACAVLRGVQFFQLQPVGTLRQQCSGLDAVALQRQ